jgi:hypothetical protein
MVFPVHTADPGFEKHFNGVIHINQNRHAEILTVSVQIKAQ